MERETDLGTVSHRLNSAASAAALALLAVLLRTAMRHVPRPWAEEHLPEGHPAAGTTAVATLWLRRLAAARLAGLADTVVVRPAGLPLTAAAIATGHGGSLLNVRYISLALCQAYII